MALFPSVEWFDAVRSVYNGDEKLHGGGAGACDARIGIKVGNGLYRLTFEGHDCIAAAPIGERDLDELDFYIAMSPEQWRSMLENIRQNGHAVFEYTLNTLDLDSEDGIALSATDDQYRTDLFFRFNQTFQNYFDASARVETTFG